MSTGPQHLQEAYANIFPNWASIIFQEIKIWYSVPFRMVIIDLITDL